MTILRATEVREGGSEGSKGKSHKCDENQGPGLRNARDSVERKISCFLSER